MNHAMRKHARWFWPFLIFVGWVALVTTACVIPDQTEWLHSRMFRGPR